MNEKLKEVIAKLKSLEKEIKEEYKAEIIGIFGSYARGEDRNGSDIDILVRFKDGATLFDFVGLANFLEEKLGMKVDVVSERALRPELEENILKDVVTI
ncbi:nucleotidyltransferase family protein [Thermodesulfovibrio yellowstonii]|uniref:Nucleotidyltransferase n=1 Tax=Thermodesulfovibrio yellowstonii TaxID=28262 RepID=A0A9W6GEI6_9BACT|nr:nucleotidyltransferase family protein [Thermodesulfovibrio islandicus]GLI52357.1 nucleotidyltransferase [Thermodesulfovibrio islandicus]